MSTATIFGGATLMRATQKDADRTLEILLKYGVNHIDTAPRYGNSEIFIGHWMARHRKDSSWLLKQARGLTRRSAKISTAPSTV